MISLEARLLAMHGFDDGLGGASQTDRNALSPNSAGGFGGAKLRQGVGELADDDDESGGVGVGAGDGTESVGRADSLGSERFTDHETKAPTSNTGGRGGGGGGGVGHPYYGGGASSASDNGWGGGWNTLSAESINWGKDWDANEAGIWVADGGEEAVDEFEPIAELAAKQPKQKAWCSFSTGIYTR